MAKKAVRKVAASAEPQGNDDAAFVQEAYGEAVKNQVKVLFENCIDGAPDPEGKFLAGLKIIRKARERALALVKQ
jgi:hypothetical protein